MTLICWWRRPIYRWDRGHTCVWRPPAAVSLSWGFIFLTLQCAACLMFYHLHTCILLYHWLVTPISDTKLSDIISLWYQIISYILLSTEMMRYWKSVFFRNLEIYALNCFVIWNLLLSYVLKVFINRWHWLIECHRFACNLNIKYVSRGPYYLKLWNSCAD